MKNNLPRHVQEWFDRAGDDELSIRALLKGEDGAPGTVCFLSQQMAEKHLKGLIAHTGQPFMKVHDLVELASVALKHLGQDNPELLDHTNFLNRFYIETRYPGDYPEFTWEDARQAFSAAEAIKLLVASFTLSQ